MHIQQISLSSSFDLQNGHQNFSMKPEVNENATLSTVNIAINDKHKLWPHNLRMPIFNLFSLIEALVISPILGKFYEKWNLKHNF